ncbi:MAG TPA: hypothetical protein H9910_00035, partial [Candidatus Mediterraneibacter quadrami]|nr:hypothetical protein [Candidatus Mediterraneibacter quadrami]
MFKKRGRIFAGILAVMLAFSSGGISALADEPGQAEEQSAQTPEENEQTEEVKETEDIKETEEIKEVEETEEIEETTTRTETDEEDNLQETDNVRDLVVSETENTETENTETDSIETYSASPENLENAKVQGEAPQGTTINLFDYWQDTQNASDVEDSQDPTSLTSGINADAALKFGKGMNTKTDLSPEYLNAWTGSEAVRQGIVKRVLTDGYPELTSEASSSETGKDLSYLFSPSVEHEGKESYPGAEGLLQMDEDGYYYYDSKQTFAEYDKGTGKFNLYEGSYWSNKNDANVGGAVLAAGSSPDGQFFPFNKAETVYTNGSDDGVKLDSSINSVNASINHYFGMTMSTRFFQQNEGKTTDGTPITYEFAGDDDVWVFIDDVLVADLGGIHDRATLKIDFSTGKIVINDGNRQGESSTLKEQFEAAGKNVSGSEWRDDTFADGTYHTLSFFYLERGNTDSNLYLKFNLVTILESGVIKVDQAGKKIPGAEFALYKATDDSYTYDDKADLICSGTTDPAGELIFRNPEDGRPISLSDIYDDGKVTNLILKETTVPDGYRSAGDMKLKFMETRNKEVFLLSDNHWDTGAYAMAKVTATTDSAEIQLLNSEQNVIKLDEAEGTLFAVVMQRQDMKVDVTDKDNWRPVYGDPLDGWHVVQEENGGVMEAVLEAARANPYIFKHPQKNSELYTADIENLPGDIRKYYYVLNEADREKAEYTVGYYYTEAATLDKATSANTCRVDSTKFGRNFSANLYVPNVQNNLFVQKLDDDGVPVSAGADKSGSAEFTLYPQNNVDIGNDGTYTVINTKGNLTANTSDMKTPLPLTGGAIFERIPNGNYYLIETEAPDGYQKSTDIVKVVVDNTGIYADAGDENDDITVERGVGSIVHSMIQFAADDDVDKTLHDIKTKLYTADGTTDPPEYNADSWVQDKKEIHFQFQGDDTLNYRTQESGGEDYGYYTIDAGWSKLKVLQCIEHASTDRKQILGEQDLTQLFSRTVIVQVKNESIGQLTIHKEVVNNTGVNVSEPDGGFSFTLTGTKEDNSELGGTLNAVRTSGGSTQTLTSTNEKITFTNGKARVSLKDDESLTLKGLPAGARMYVKEDTYSDYKTTYKVGTDSGQPGQTEETEDPPSVMIQENTPHTVEVTNTCHLEGDFTFTKIERTGEGEQAEDKPLSDAVFAVYKLECMPPGSPSGDAGHDHKDKLIEIENPATGALAEGETCWELVGSPVTSGTDGTVVIKDIPVLAAIQEYRLVELKAPPGFTRPQGQWKLEYDADGKKFIPVTGTTGDPNSASVGNPPAIEEASEDGTTTTYKIRNYRPGELPFSGNTGIRMFLLLGGGLMLLGAAGGCGWYVHRRRRTVRRRR